MSEREWGPYIQKACDVVVEPRPWRVVPVPSTGDAAPLFRIIITEENA